MQMDAFSTTCSRTTKDAKKVLIITSLLWFDYFVCTHGFPLTYGFPLCDMSEIRSDMYTGASTGYGPYARKKKNAPAGNECHNVFLFDGFYI